MIYNQGNGIKSLMGKGQCTSFAKKLDFLYGGFPRMICLLGEPNEGTILYSAAHRFFFPGTALSVSPVFQHALCGGVISF